MPYKLSATLRYHTADVRDLSTPKDDLILSVSRDATAVVWEQSSTDSGYQPTSKVKPGTKYVNSVAYIPPSPQAPQGYMVTGGLDTAINIFSLESPKDVPDIVLHGHGDNVCALNTTPDGMIVSGSWDRTARVWKNFKLVHDLRGHHQSVWAVLAVAEEDFLTGSADKTIKLWHQHKALYTYTGHQDAVRDLALLPAVGFASCSNDSEIRVWTLSGDLLYTLSGHTSLIYSISLLPSGDIVSCGEDRSVRVWHEGECVQVIVHPAISVWTVSILPNGDIVSGSSDGVVRIFSAAEERWASADELQEYEDAVSGLALPLQQVGYVTKTKLPGPEALREPGTKNGEIKLIKRGSIVETHQWDAIALAWTKIGDNFVQPKSVHKQVYEGAEYDYIFDVDVEDGVPPLKLPYNLTDSPLSAAQSFIELHNLPRTYLNDVVRFIEQNTISIDMAAQAYRRSIPLRPKIIEGGDIPSLAKFMLSERCKKVVLMLGAGVSTSAGIPDFRTPGTGLYSNLARLNLPHPEAVFEIDFFRKNPVPFYALAHELYPGKYRPTITHSFVRLLAQHNLLQTCFTQNIDTLERRAGVPSDKIIEAHGSFATQKCIDCLEPYDDEAMKQVIREQKIPFCAKCKGLVKPDIVFFGESLPSNFVGAISDLEEADLLIVIGTSLSVHPFASLTRLAKQTCPRILINVNRVGDFGTRPDDLLLLGKCDETVIALAKELGWYEELQALWEETASITEQSRSNSPATPSVTSTPLGADEEVHKLAIALEEKMTVNKEDAGEDVNPGEVHQSV